MTNKAILFTKLNTAELQDAPMPSPGAGEVLVRLVRSTISSGTERANLTGVPDNATSIYRTCPDAQVTWPRRCGYSSAGVVEAVGEGVTSVKAGDRVALSWTTHQHYVSLPETCVYRLPDAVSFEQGALAHISTFPMAAIRSSRRLLLTYLTDVQNEGTRYGDADRRFLVAWGNGRPCALDGTAEVSVGLENPDAYAVYSLDTSGARRARLPACVRQGSLNFDCRVKGSDGKACLAYEIIRQ